VSTEEELKEFMSCFALTTRLLGPSLILAVVLLVIALQMQSISPETRCPQLAAVNR